MGSSGINLVYVLPRHGIPNLWHVAKATYPQAADILCGSRSRVSVETFTPHRPGSDQSPGGVLCSVCDSISSGLLDLAVTDVRMHELEVLVGLEKWLRARDRSEDNVAISFIDGVCNDFVRLSEVRERYGRCGYGEELRRLEEKARG